MQNSMGRSASRNNDLVRDRLSSSYAQQDSRLQSQAGSLLSDPSSMDAFQHRISPANSSAQTAFMAENKDTLRAMNAGADQVSQMLSLNPITDLFDALKDHDRAQAMDFAVHHQELHRHALNMDGDVTFSQELRLRLTGNA